MTRLYIILPRESLDKLIGLFTGLNTLLLLLGLLVVASYLGEQANLENILLLILDDLFKASDCFCVVS